MPENNPGTLDAIGIELVNMLQPIKQRVDDDEVLVLLAELGIQFPETLKSNPAFGSAMDGLVSNIAAMPDIVKALIDAIKAEDWDTVSDKSFELAEKIADTVQKFTVVKDALESFPMGGLSSGERVALDDFIGNFVRYLLDYLIIQYLETKSEAMVAGFEFFGIVERSVQNTGSSNPAFPEYVRYKLHLNNVVEFFNNPNNLLANLYDWGKPTFTGHAMLEKLHKLALGLGFPSVYNPSIPELDVLFLKITPNTSLSPLPGLNILIHETFGADAAFSIGNADWNLTASLDASIPVQAGITLRPSGEVSLVPPAAGPFNGDFVITFTVPGQGGSPTPYILVGEADASRFEFKQFRLEAGVGLTWNPGDGEAQGRFHVEGELQDGKIVIKPRNPDGFLSKILPEDGISIDLSLLIGYDSERGFYFDGSGGLEIQLPTNLQLGPLLIESLILSIQAGSDGIPLGIGANIGLQLGPFAAVVENMGIQATLTFPPDSSGNLGAANLDVDFKPPTGVGLAIDAGVVKGGGFLRFEYEKGRYTGIVYLSIKEMVNVTAIGLITTKNPDGSPGFSLLLLITAEFTPIQLGFGFTLNGVGGIVGVNRTMVLVELQAGVRNNTLDNILFPSNPIANATQIITDLEKVFPPLQNRFTFGPMGLLGWGTPTLISIELGLMLEVPNPIRLAILGVIKMVLPTEEAAILKLQVNFVGTIDFEAKYLTFDASLFDSKLLIFTLEGDMALRIKWGENSNFLFTVGGFHPDYTPPPLNLPSLKRLSISLMSGNPRLTISSYFAVTSNTVQFGAGVDFYFGVSKFKVLGYLYFDALFQFNPFYFKISIAAGLGVYIGSKEILSIHLAGSLEGPTPWHITGKIKFKILFFIKISVSIERTWGESKNTSLPDIQVLPKLKEALLNKANWLTPVETFTQNLDNLVTLRSIENTDEDIIAHPSRSLTVSQKVVPLDISIEKFGTQNPSDFTRFHLDMVDDQEEDIADTPVKEEFAPDSFFKLTESERLSRPSFEKYNSGLTGTGASNLTSDYFMEREVQFEQIILDEPDPQPVLVIYDVLRFNAFIRNGSVARSALGSKFRNTSPLEPSKVNINEENFAVVNSNNLSIFENHTATSLQEAQVMMNSILSDRPELEGQLDVVSAFELV